MTKKIASILMCIAVIATSCKQTGQPLSTAEQLDKLATDYVRLGLTIGQYDANFVDAYYGPDSLKPKGAAAKFPKDSLLDATSKLLEQSKGIAAAVTNDTLKNRANWIGKQLIAFGRRIHIFSGEFKTFDEEAKELFDVTPPVYDEAHFKNVIARLDSILPGKGNVEERFQQLASRFLLPKDKMDIVFRTTIAEARKRVLAHYPLPSTETFTLEYVGDKTWSGYNWYKGQYTSLIQINASRAIYLDRAIDLACHEGYPGHHVYNMLLEQKLYRKKGWVEISLYPLFSPQSLIAEGSANFGIEVAFPGNERVEYCKNVLLPLAGMDTTGVSAYFEALAIKTHLNYARNEVARGILNGTMKETEALRWLMAYCLMDVKGAVQSLNFIKVYRSYVINYNYGMDLVRNYINKQGGTDSNPDKRWELFGHLLSNEVVAGEL